MRTVCLLLSSALISHPLLGQAGQEGGEQPWQWSVEKVQSLVGEVRAGRDLTPEAWPGGGRVAVALSFDFDAETNALRDESFSPGVFSQGEYAARVAIPRVLDLLDRHGISATFFVPAVSALLHLEQMKAIVAKERHEIGMHGWIHERNALLDEETERLLMRKAYETLHEIAGKAPVGIRTPSWDFSRSTVKLIKEMGLLYDSSLMADDRPYEILIEGNPTGVVELPVEWLLDDYPYFGFSRFSSVRPQIKPTDVLEIWKAEFDEAYREGTLFVLTMHPKYIGHRSRIAMLDELIHHMMTFEGVWFATHEEVARHVRGQIAR
jgi:peptidoglycan/xylan/chitin deacetylase (PgdA/CDA1 family)